MRVSHKCKTCDKSFESVSEIANHVRWAHRERDYSEEGLQKQRAKARRVNDKKYGAWVTDTVRCHKCGKPIEIRRRVGKTKPHYFCSKWCSHSRPIHHSKATRQKISEASRRAWQRDEYVKKVTSHRIFSSKRKREIREHFISSYPSDGWTFGGTLSRGGERIARDLYSNTLKVCIEYDGVWHFRDIHDQLARKQRKDRLLEAWCIANRYRLVRITESSALSLDEIEVLVYHRKQPITKVGEEYE